MLTNPIFRFFASLKLAVLSLLGLAACLAYGTVYESLFGTRAVHLQVYSTYWFFGELLILGLNVFCAALSRYPWKHHQIGFVITHSGILTILLGSFFTQRFGLDGNLPVLEGGYSSEVILHNLHLNLRNDKSLKTLSLKIPETPRRSRGELLSVDLGNNEKLLVTEFIPRSVTERKILPSPVPKLGTPAIRFEIGNNRFRVDDWLLIRHPTQPAQLNLGPAVVEFQHLSKVSQEKEFLTTAPTRKISSKGHLLVEYKGQQHKIKIDTLDSFQQLATTPYFIRVDRYLPYAIVQDNQLVNKSDTPVNPAVQFTVRDSQGTEEKHTAFALFPEFATLHGSVKKKNTFGLRFQMISAQMQNQEGRNSGTLEIASTLNPNRLLYRATSRRGKITSGEAKVGEAISTGWMDLKFSILEWIPYAVEEYVPVEVDQVSGMDSNFLAAIQVSLVLDSNGISVSRWIREGSGELLATRAGNLSLSLSKETMQLPFQIHLNKFTIGNDPGTTKAASYESQVVVRDPSLTTEPMATISMNEPLEHGGYTFYQASYQLQEGRPPISVFSVNFDPGRWIKYGGSLIMILGILIMFYMNPHYWGILLGKRKRET